MCPGQGEQPRGGAGRVRAESRTSEVPGAARGSPQLRLAGRAFLHLHGGLCESQPRPLSLGNGTPAERKCSPGELQFRCAKRHLPSQGARGGGGGDPRSSWGAELPLSGDTGTQTGAQGRGGGRSGRAGCRARAAAEQTGHGLPGQGPAAAVQDADPAERAAQARPAGQPRGSPSVLTR